MLSLGLLRPWWSGRKTSVLSFTAVVKKQNKISNEIDFYSNTTKSGKGKLF